ncbi:expansin-like B1 [Gastrolobium bilobum]|uniref:expansin-like B1 n=1 Tax=Gastrolobium bilobum TaxID=150636 RepID=UPI002AAF2257|nr:expansin-like B1 [Gastrolobium bilobum]
MELSLKHQLGLVCVILLFPALCYCKQYTESRATYYGTPDGYGNPNGACGFGDYGRTIQDGSVAAVAGLWRNGAGCGACYRVRCTLPGLCNHNGAIVLATDYGQGDRTDFIMSPRAFAKLGRDAKASAELAKYGVVDIEFERVSCKYPGQNIMFHVQESSNNPGYFAVVLLYVDGAYDVSAVEMYLKNTKEWMPLRRVYGAVFDYQNPPSGEFYLRFQVSGSAGVYWKQSKIPIPGNWKAGATYDSKVQI